MEISLDDFNKDAAKKDLVLVTEEDMEYMGLSRPSNNCGPPYECSNWKRSSVRDYGGSEQRCQ